MRDIGSELRQATLKVCWFAMLPLAKIMVRFGIGYRDFVEVSRAAFVEAAVTELASDGQRVTIGRISARTGLSRKEIGKLRSNKAPQFSEAKVSLPLADLLSDWGSSPAYMATDGRPVLLPFRVSEPNRLSFENLAKAHMPNIPPTTVLNELLSYECVEQTKGGLKLLSRQFVPPSVEPQTVELAGRALYALGSTLAHNLSPDKADSKCFERMAMSTKLHPHAVPRFLAQVNESAQNLLQMTDDWIVSNETSSKSKTTRLTGVGVYAFDVDELTASGSATWSTDPE